MNDNRHATPLRLTASRRRPRFAAWPASSTNTCTNTCACGYGSNAHVCLTASRRRPRFAAWPASSTNTSTNTCACGYGSNETLSLTQHKTLTAVG